MDALRTASAGDVWTRADSLRVISVTDSLADGWEAERANAEKWQRMFTLEKESKPALFGSTSQWLILGAGVLVGVGMGYYVGR